MTKGRGTDRAERRRHPRFQVSARVQVGVRDAEQDPGFWAEVENVSAGGCFVATSQKVPVDTEVLVTIYPTEGTVVHAVGRVMHTSERGFGCCFAYVPKQSKVSLDRWLGRSGGLGPMSGTIDDDEEPVPDEKPSA
jgi:hypothetical protein